MERRILLRWFFGIIIFFAILGDFARIMTTFNHNEHMYIAAGVLVAQNNILYKDFAYLQTPYLPLLYGSIFKVLGINSFYLLTGKVTSFIALLISGVSVLFLARRLYQDRTIALGLVALFLLNMSIVIPAQESSNYIIPLALSLWAVCAFDVSLDSSKNRKLLTAISGLLLALAAGVKLTYLPVMCPFLVVILYFSKLRTGSLSSLISERLLPFMTGFLMGCLPLFGFLLSDPESFVFNNLGYHSLNSQWRFLTGYTDAMSWPSKLVFASEIFLKTDNLILLVGSILGAIVLFRNSRTIKRFPVGVVLALLLWITALLTALAPTPSFYQYYALPVSFLFILLMYLWAPTINRKSSLQIILLIMVLFTLMSNAASLVESVKKLSDRSKWSGVHIHEMSVKIREILIENRLDPNGKVATLSPLFALEGGLSIYNELATGPFLYRVGDLLAPHQRVLFVATSPETVHRLLENDPPVAILTGYEGDLDDPLIKYAEENTYRKVDLAGFEGILLIRSR